MCIFVFKNYYVSGGYIKFNYINYIYISWLYYFSYFKSLSREEKETINVSVLGLNK